MRAVFNLVLAAWYLAALGMLSGGLAMCATSHSISRIGVLSVLGGIFSWGAAARLSMSFRVRPAPLPRPCRRAMEESLELCSAEGCD